MPSKPIASFCRLRYGLSCTLLMALGGFVPAARAADPIEISIHLEQPVRPISPYVYGINIHGDIPNFDRATMLRDGGKSVSTYNWENNSNNAGTDVKHANGVWVSRLAEGTPLAKLPASSYRQTHEHGKAIGAYDLIQVPMIDYVAADADGPVTEAERAPSKRWKKVEPRKPGPFTDPPDTTDDVVYIDELVDHLVKLYGRADAGGVRGYSLDNEVDGWEKTHPRVRKEACTVKELIERSVAWAEAIKAVDPSAEVYGFSPTHMSGYVNFDNAKDWPAIQRETEAKGYKWFIDYYLDAMRQAGEKSGKRLLDVLEIHAYTDAEIEKSGGYDGVLQGPRWYWDPTYRQPTWIGERYPEFLPLIPKLQESIDKFYPGTKLAITEYNGQMQRTIYGSLAQVDNLGAFGRQGVYAATLWSQLGYEKDDKGALPLTAAMNLYRNFDGNGGCFADESVDVTNPRPDLLSVYAARDSKSDNVHVVVIGKTRTVSTPVRIHVLAGAGLSRVEQWGYDGNSYAIKHLDSMPIHDGRVELDIPKTSARHMVFSKQGSGYARPTQPEPTRQEPAPH